MRTKKRLFKLLTFAVLLQTCIFVNIVFAAGSRKSTLSPRLFIEQGALRNTFTGSFEKPGSIVSFILNAGKNNFTLDPISVNGNYRDADADASADKVSGFAEQLGIFSAFSINNIHTATREGVFNLLKHARGKGLLAYRPIYKYAGEKLTAGIEIVIIDTAEGIDLKTIQAVRERNMWRIDYDGEADGYGFILIPNSSGECVFESRGLQAELNKKADEFVVSEDNSSQVTAGTRITLRWWGQERPQTHVRKEIACPSLPLTRIGSADDFIIPVVLIKQAV